MPNVGRVNVVLRPGDRIPPDCTILRCFDEPKQWNAHAITIEAEWLWYGEEQGDLTVLEFVTMDEVWKRRMAFTVGPLEALVGA